jgi:hypothetical protein
MTEEQIEYHVRWRHVPPYLMMTPLMMISIDHTRVFAKQDATEWDIQCAIAGQLGNLNISPSHVDIESFQPLTSKQEVK